MDFEFIDFAGGAQAEMEARVGTGGVAAAGEEVGALADTIGGEEHFGADGIAGGLVKGGSTSGFGLLVDSQSIRWSPVSGTPG